MKIAKQIILKWGKIEYSIMCESFSFACATFKSLVIPKAMPHIYSFILCASLIFWHSLTYQDEPSISYPGTCAHFVMDVLKEIIQMWFAIHPAIASFSPFHPRSKYFSVSSCVCKMIAFGSSPSSIKHLEIIAFDILF